MRDKIDWDTRVILLKLIGKYDSYKKELDDERDRILSLSPQNYNNLDMPKGTDTSDATACAVIQLERLDGCYKAKVIKAIDQARDFTLSEELKTPIFKSCLNSRRYTYEYFKGLSCGRTRFYQYKNEFLNDLRYRLGL